jgi:hypothetical protein
MYYIFCPSYFSKSIQIKLTLCYRVGQSGLTESLSKITRSTKVVGGEVSDEEKDNLLAKRESSHEYD